MAGTLLLWQVKHRCMARWRRTELMPHQSRSVQVKIGTLTTGGWYVDTIKPDVDECRPYPDQQTAREVAHRWMDRLGGEWEQIPCYPTEGWQPGERERADDATES